MPRGVQIVNVNLKDTFDGKTTLIWCCGVPLVSWGVVGYRGVWLSHMVNIHTFWRHGVSLIISFGAHGVYKLLMSI